jgi:zinc protease
MNGNDRANLIMPVYIRVAPENAQATFQFVAQAVENLAVTDGISLDELNRVRSQMIKSQADNLADNNYWSTVLRMYDKFGEDMSSDYVKIIQSLTPDDIADFAKTYLIPANRIQLEMSPND